MLNTVPRCRKINYLSVKCAVRTRRSVDDIYRGVEPAPTTEKAEPSFLIGWSPAALFLLVDGPGRDGDGEDGEYGCQNQVLFPQ